MSLNQFFNRKPQEPSPVPELVEAETVRAQRFELVDAAGNIRMEFGLNSGGFACMACYDELGQQRAVFGLGQDGAPTLLLADSTALVRIGIVAHDEGSGLWFSDGVNRDQMLTMVGESITALPLPPAPEGTSTELPTLPE